MLLSSSGVTALGVVAKLADLGLSRIVRNHRSHHSTNTVGTMSHVAPELLRYGHMSTAGDVYAFGIMSKCSWTVVIVCLMSGNSAC